MLKNLDKALLELIRLTSCSLPEDVKKAIETGLSQEEKFSPAYSALQSVLNNVDIAGKKSLPLCQDTGTNYFVVEFPLSEDPEKLKESITRSIQEASRSGYLRPNSVDPITGRNTGDNTGIGHPSIDFIPVKTDILQIKLMLKGGGCENMGVQYSLPDETISAGRDINGIKRCLLDAVYKAQGYGCAPGILGVCIGGDRGDSLKTAKKQLFRKIGEYHSDEVLRELEIFTLEKANQLGIGPMGYGGKTTLLGVFVEKLNRIPASFFVSVSYMCWACRRKSLTLYPDGRFTVE